MSRLLQIVVVMGVALLVGSARAESVALDAERSSLLRALPHLYGPELAAPDLRGKVVVLTFFASWCPPCHVEFQHLKAVHAEFHDRGVTVIAINLFENFGRFADDGARLAGFFAKYQPAFTVLAGNDSAAAAFGAVSRIPTLLVFDRRGHPALEFTHKRKADKTNPDLAEVRAAIRSAL